MTREEVALVIQTIQQYDTVINDTLLFCGKIDRESEWNPTSRTDGGKSRGLFNIGVAEADEVCRRYGFQVTNMERALYNPAFNTKVGVLFYTDLYRNYALDHHKFPMLCWNSGRSAAGALVAKGVGIRGTHWKNVQQRMKDIEKARSVIVKQ